MRYEFRVMKLKTYNSEHITYFVDFLLTNSFSIHINNRTFNPQNFEQING